MKTIETTFKGHHRDCELVDAGTFICHAECLVAQITALEARNERGIEMIERLQQSLAKGGWYERAETCAAILDALNGIER